MPKSRELDPNEEYGRTRGLDEYHHLVDTHPKIKDNTVLAIADKALKIVVYIDKRDDIVPETAARATVKALTEETFRGHRHETG